MTLDLPSILPDSCAKECFDLVRSIRRTSRWDRDNLKATLPVDFFVHAFEVDRLLQSDSPRRGRRDKPEAADKEYLRLKPTFRYSVFQRL